MCCAFTGMSQAQQSSASKDKVVYVVGNVVKPSKVAFTEGMTLAQAIKDGGGILANKKSKFVQVIRLIPRTQYQEVIEIKLNEKKKIEDFLLQPNDIIEIVRKKSKGKILLPISQDIIRVQK